MNSWDFGDFVFVEHFAVADIMRGKGFGSEILKNFCRDVQRPVVLEVELPNTAEAIRRIVYERHGFNVVSQTYMQPSLRQEIFLFTNVIVVQR